MAYRKPPTIQELNELRRLCEAAPHATAKQIAKQWGRNPVTTGQYMKRLRLGSPAGRALARQIKCVEPLATIFRTLDAQGMSLASQAQKLGVTANTLGAYRRGEQSPSLYLTICLAQMAHFEFKLQEAA